MDSVAGVLSAADVPLRLERFGGPVSTQNNTNFNKKT